MEFVKKTPNPINQGKPMQKSAITERPPGMRKNTSKATILIKTLGFLGF